MYEDCTYENILSRMLGNAPDRYDKREGSIMMNMLAPVAMELFIAYRELEKIVTESFADTQSRDYLILRAREKGIEPMPSSPSHWIFTFDTSVPLNTRFSVGEFTFVTVANIENYDYEMMCEQSGSNSNVLVGEILPLDYVQGLNSAEIKELLVLGQDEEDTESLRARYFEYVELQAFGGNIADYKEKAMAIDGVGEVKVIPIWDGGGTVKVIFSTSDYKVPTEDFVSKVQNIFDPDTAGKGLGLAPIGHKCTVKGVKAKVIDLSFTITQKNAGQNLSSAIELKIDELFTEYAKQWSTSDGMTIRLSQIESKLLKIRDILDVSNLKINNASQNLAIDEDFIPIRGDIDATVD